MPNALILLTIVDCARRHNRPVSGRLTLGNQRVPAAFVVVGNGDSDRRLERRS